MRYIASDKPSVCLFSAFRKDGNVRHEDDEILSGLLTTESISGDICEVSKSADPRDLHLRALKQLAKLSCVHLLLKSSKPGEMPSLAGC